MPTWDNAPVGAKIGKERWDQLLCSLMIRGFDCCCGKQSGPAVSHGLSHSRAYPLEVCGTPHKPLTSGGFHRLFSPSKFFILSDIWKNLTWYCREEADASADNGNNGETAENDGNDSVNDATETADGEAEEE